VVVVFISDASRLMLLLLLLMLLAPWLADAVIPRRAPRHVLLTVFQFYSEFSQQCGEERDPPFWDRVVQLELVEG